MTWCAVHATMPTEGTVCHHCLAAAVEVPALRTLTDKHFALPDGRMLAERSNLGPVHYETAEGLVEYDPQWTRRGRGWTLGGMPFVAHAKARGVGYTLVEGGERFVCRMVEPRSRAVAVGEGPRLFWDVSEDLTVYIMAHPLGVSTHYILRSAAAPREFVWTYEGETPWRRPSGRDNLDRLPGRIGLDVTRPVDAHMEIAADTLRVLWSGKVKATDTLRRRRLTDDVLYPVRVKH